jgi:prepilin-type N-terminal cleavage/methylation domain-containing protein
MKNARRPGFSRVTARGLGLVELLVAVAIVGVLVGVAIPSLSDLLERRRVVAIAQELAGILNFARSETNANGDAIVVRFDKDPDGKRSCAMVNVLQVFHYSCRCYREQAQICGTAPVPILRVFQVENAQGVSFEATSPHWEGAGPLANFVTLQRGQYFAGASGVNITVSGKRTGAALRVELNEVNRVRVCSPDRSISGYPACG